MRFKYLFVLGAIALFFASCHSILLKDIQNDKVTLLAPGDSVSTKVSTVTFWWEVLDGADSYRLQIVSPSFDGVQQFIIDTLVASDKFTMQLNPGVYQWRLRGESSAYQSKYVVRTLTIDTTTDLSVQTLILVSPADNYHTSQSTIHFQWTPFSYADDYRFEIASPDFNGATLVSVNVTADTFSYSLPDGQYQWRVRAQNATTNTQFSTRSFIIDTSAPTAPALVSPLSGTTVTDTISMHWTRDASSKFDSVFVYGDSLVNPAIYYSTSLVDSFRYINSTSGTYYWRVRSVDSSGNVSPYSNLWKFTIQ